MTENVVLCGTSNEIGRGFAVGITRLQVVGDQLNADEMITQIQVPPLRHE